MVSSFAATRTTSQLVSQIHHTCIHRHHTVLANVSTLLVNIYELAECFDDVDILFSPSNNELGTLMQAVVEDLQRFQDVPPVLALVVQPLVEHVHNLVEFGRPEDRQVRT